MHEQRPIHKAKDYLEWYIDNLCGSNSPEPNGRKLTVSDILGEGEGDQTQDTLTALLEAAETAQENAEQHQMLADQASGEHERLMGMARDMLPDGWMLVRGGVDWAAPDKPDMTDPRELAGGGCGGVH